MKKLTVQDIQQEHIGIYKCLSGDDTVIKTFELDSNFKVKKLPKSISVDDGTPEVEIECSLRAVKNNFIDNGGVFMEYYIPYRPDKSLIPRRHIST